MLNRRQFFAAAAAAPAHVVGAAEPPAVIDTHTHFYDPTRPEGVPWPAKDDKLLYRPVLPAEFQKLVRPHGVTGTVIVEASPWIKDNDWLLALGQREPFIRGVVGRLYPVPDTSPDQASDEFARQLAGYAKNPLFRGIRIAAGEVAKAVEAPAAIGNLGRLADAGLTLDVNGPPDILPSVGRLAKELPALRIVLNHMANPRIDGTNIPADWRTGILELGKRPNVWCKLSALVEGSGRRDGKAPRNLAFYRPALDVLWKAFGDDRLLYGSNWPVSGAFAPYSTVFAIANEFLTAQGDAARKKVMGGNAIKAYGLRWGE